LAPNSFIYNMTDDEVMEKFVKANNSFLPSVYKVSVTSVSEVNS
jgi:hypothetical protein